jgi:hypothetical protein
MTMKVNELLPMLLMSDHQRVLQYCFPQFVCMVFILGIMALLLFDDDSVDSGP